MKAKIIVLLLGLLLLLQSGCGLISGLKDLTNSATILLDSASELLRLIDSKVETGELSQEAAALIDGRIENLMNLINASLQENGGFLFDQANGLIDNTFANTSVLLDQIKRDILDGSIPAIIDQVSAQLQLQINLLSSQLEDLVVLTFGNIFVFVDKATNSIVIISSIIIFAIGTIIFAVMFLKQKEKLTGARIVGLVLVGIFVLFFLGIILVTPLRAYVIAGFNFGEKVEGLALQPKVRGVIPETFVLGKNNRIIVYGNHLNLIKELKVQLFTGTTRQFSFPDNTVAVATQNRIILGNFDTELNWKPITYQEIVNQNIIPAALLEPYAKFSTEFNDVIYPGRKRIGPGIGGGLAVAEPPQIGGQDLPILLPKGPFLPLPLPKLKLPDYFRDFNRIGDKYFGQRSSEILKKISDTYLTRFKLPPGDFGLTVFDGETRVEGPQFITIVNPPPPPPKPDIDPLSLNWDGGVQAVKDQSTRLALRIGFSHPEEIKTPFQVRITSPQLTVPLNISVPLGISASAISHNFADVTSSNFTPRQSGNFQFTAIADQANIIAESNESNNQHQQNLSVRDVVYDVQMIFTTFQATSDEETGSENEYRISVDVTVTGFSRWEFSINRNGEPGNYNVDESRSFNGLRPGATFTIHTSGHEADDGFNGGDDPLGSANTVQTLGTNLGPLPGGNTPTEAVRELKPAHYNLFVKFIIRRRTI